MTLPRWEAAHDKPGFCSLRDQTEITDPEAQIFSFPEQKTMYGGQAIAAGDIIFLFASETEGGLGWWRAAS
jgi:hypothetical protein